MEEKAQAKLEQSFGGKAVGLKFNPTGNGSVLVIKANAATSINVLHKLRNETDDGEKKRMYSIAITELQSAQMWAVKAATWGL